MKVVSWEKFLTRVEHEVDMMKQHGTAYRYKTALLGLEVAKSQKNVNLFRNRDTAFTVVAHVLPNEDVHRKEDVTQTLQSMLWQMERKLNLSMEQQQRLAEKSKHYKLVLVK